MSDVKISIQSGTISVDKNKVQVKKGVAAVDWKCKDGTFSIEFKPGSDWPNPKTVQQGSNWVAQAGPFPVNGSLFYSITAPKAPTLDPEIEVFG